MYIPTILVLTALSQLVKASPIPQLITAKPTDSLTAFDSAAPTCYSTCAVSVEDTCNKHTVCSCAKFVQGIMDCLEKACPSDRKSEEWMLGKISVCEKEEERATRTRTTFSGTLTVTTPTSTATRIPTTTASASASATTSEAAKKSSKIPTSYIIGIAISSALGTAILLTLLIVLLRRRSHRFRRLPPPNLSEAPKYFPPPPPPPPPPRHISPLTVPVPAYTPPPLPPLPSRPSTASSTFSKTHAPPTTPTTAINKFLFAKLPPPPAELPALQSPGIKGPNPYNAYLRTSLNPLRRALTTKSWVSESPSNYRASTAVNIGFLTDADRSESFDTAATRGTSTVPPSSCPSTPSLAAFPIPPGAVPAVPKLPTSIGPKVIEKVTKREKPKPKSWVYTSDDEITEEEGSDGDETELWESSDERSRRGSTSRPNAVSRSSFGRVGKALKRRSIRSVGKVGVGRGLVVVPTEKRVSTRPWEDRFWVAKVEEEEIARSPVRGKGETGGLEFKGKGKEKETDGEKAPAGRALAGRAPSPLGGRPLTPEGVDESELEEMEKLVGEMGRI
ncbi:hypothetical protein BJ508DRAFT_378813 [Ascobolus immersus RN42]|uniref:Extracellular membrane protein CFEM domain-containing protein n=1 Tax=Ascobolus immersus RN42 TaxID=1160509 RepID=A0A3N4HYK0_ASCIM|nr:hypothetical protein BJ508DRAFT_378813 [Ascobolus immersus RN42]